MSTSASFLTGITVFWLFTCILLAIYGKSWNAEAPFYLAVAPLRFRLDPLSSIFIALLGIISISIALYSPGYLVHQERQPQGGQDLWQWLVLPLQGRHHSAHFCRSG